MTRVSSKIPLAAAFAAMHAIIGLLQHWHFESSAYDLGIFDQVVWHLSRFEAPASTILGLHNVLGDHFSPIWIVAAPLYWLHAAPETLIVLQGVLFGASVVPVWIFLERRLPATPALLLSIAYGLFWGLQRASQFDVHELAFAPVLIALMILGIDNAARGSAPWTLFLSGAVPLCVVKEDQIPVVAAAAGLLALRAQSRRTRAIAAAIAAAALVAFVVVVRWIIPSLSDTGAYAVGSAFAGSLADPFTAIAHLFSPPTKLETLAMWLLPFACLPLFSPYGLLILPLMLERFLSASPNHWGTVFHYSAPLAPILAMAAGDALGRAARSPLFTHTRVVGVSGFCVLASALLPGHQPVWKLLVPRTYAARPFADVARRALAVIPGSAPVAAHNAIAPHLSARAEIYMLRPNASDPGVRAAYVIAAPDDLSPWPFAGPDDLRATLATYRARGYTTVFEERSWIVLAAPGAPQR